MSLVTLLQEGQDRPGHEFIYRGPSPECKECKVKAVCLNQEVGKRYRVMRLRDVLHPCPLSGFRARVVEVEPVAPAFSIHIRRAVEGSVVEYQGLDCNRTDCPNYRICHPMGVEIGMKVKVVKVGQELRCPLGYEITPVDVEYMP